MNGPGIWVMVLQHAEFFRHVSRWPMIMESSHWPSVDTIWGVSVNGWGCPKMDRWIFPFNRPCLGRDGQEILAGVAVQTNWMLEAQKHVPGRPVPAQRCGGSSPETRHIVSQVLNHRCILRCLRYGSSLFWILFKGVSSPMWGIQHGQGEKM